MAYEVWQITEKGKELVRTCGFLSDAGGAEVGEEGALALARRIWREAAPDVKVVYGKDSLSGWVFYRQGEVV